MLKEKSGNLVVVDEQKDVLSPEDQARLQQCENTIREGQNAFLKTCVAIVTIDAGELFRPHKSLHAYCAFVFDFSDTETGRYRNAGHVLMNLSGLSAEELFAGVEADTVLPVNEGQCREMARIKNADGQQDADLQRKVWAEVIKRAGKEKITAKLIRDVVDELVDGVEAVTSSGKPCSAKLTLRIEEHEGYDTAGAVEDAAKYFGVECSRRKNNLTFGVEADSKEKLLKKLAGWAAKYDVTRIVVDFS